MGAGSRLRRAADPGLGRAGEGKPLLAVFCVVGDRIAQGSTSANLSVEGAFEQLRVVTFPHVVANLGVMARFEIHAAESGRQVTANVALVDEHGTRVHLDQRVRLLPVVEDGHSSLWDFALNLSRVQFDAPGRFEVVLRVDKEIVAAAEIWVVAE